MSKYIIDTGDYLFTTDGVLVVGFDCDNKPATFYNSLDNLEELNSDYINENFGELQDEAYKRGYADAERIWRAPSSDNEFYQKGLEDAWEATKKIFGYEIDGAIPIADIGNVFGYEPCKAFCTADILRDFTVQEAIAKLKAYEDKHSDRIEVGDEVATETGKKYTVVSFGGSDTVCGFNTEGRWMWMNPKDVTKTGKHYDIQSILEAMRT